MGASGETKTKSMDLEQERELYAGLQAVIGPIVGGAIKEIAAAADFELSREASRPFVEFVHWVNSRPAFIARWRSDPVTERRDYLRFMTVTDDARSAYAAACYHLGRLQEIEATVHAVLSRYDFTKQFPPNSIAAIGRMRQLDFEYHAFVLAYRRCLDYLAWGLSAYFNQRQNSFRRLAKTLTSGHPTAVAQILKRVYDCHAKKFEFVMGDERGKSVRDRIGHSEFVQAATINVGSNGHRFVGGGEKLRLTYPTDERTLSEILESRALDLHDCISDFLDSFRSAVVEHESNSP
jgi:hypothetical protein